MPLSPEERAVLVADGYTPEEVEGISAAYDEGYTTEEIDAHLKGSTPAETYSAGRRAEAEARKKGALGVLKEGGYALATEPAIRSLENVQQLGLAVGEKTGLFEPGSARDFTEKMTLRRIAATGNEGIDEQMADAGEALLLSIPGINMGRAALGAKWGAFKLNEPTTYIRGIAQTMKQSAIAGGLGMGAMEAPPSQEEYDAAAAVLAERRFGAIMAATVGGAGATILMAPTGFRNMLARMAKDADENTTTVELLKNAVLSKYDFFLSQRTGNTRIRNLEIQIAATRAQNAFNEQFGKFAGWTDNLLTAWKRGAGINAPVDDTALALTIQKGWRRELQNTITAANDSYAARMGVALTHAQGAGPVTLPVDNAWDVASRWASTATDEPWWRKLHPGAKSLNPEFQEFDDHMAAMQAAQRTGGPPPSMTFEQMVRMRRALNNADKPYYDAKWSPNGPTREQQDQHRAATEFRAAMDADIDAYLARNAGNPNDPMTRAIEEYRAANKAYTQDREVIDGLEQTSVNQMFGYQIDKNPAMAILDMARRSPGQQQIVVDALRRHHPEGLHAMQVYLLQEANANLNKLTGPAVAGKFDPEAWAKRLLTEENRLAAERIFTPDQLTEIGRGLDTIRILNNGIQSNGQLITSIGSTPEIQGLVMALASANNAFIARGLMRIGGGAPIERILFTKEGQEILDTIVPIAKQIQLGRVTVMPRDAPRAIAKFTAIMAAQEAEEVKAKQQQQPPQQGAPR